jgi:hypothetical protein
MAALLATLVLDDQAMEILQQRGEGHLVFEAALKLVSLSRRFCETNTTERGRWP